LFETKGCKNLHLMVGQNELLDVGFLLRTGRGPFFNNSEICSRIVIPEIFATNFGSSKTFQ
jgi:hypothetical protein